MIESKMRNNVIENTKLSRNNISAVPRKKSGKMSSREKIIMKEKKSIVISKYKTFFKSNIFKIAALFLVLFCVLTYINSNKKIDINENSNIAKLNASKYSLEIANLYNRDGELDLFLKEMNRVQSLIGTYVISNSTLKENSFTELVNKLNNEINNDKWQTLDSEKSSYYNGKYTIDDSGNLKFKFDNKQIEPNWINSESISRYIILN